MYIKICFMRSVHFDEKNDVAYKGFIKRHNNTIYR